MSVDQCARVLEFVDPSAHLDDTISASPRVLPRVYRLDGWELPDGAKIVDIDGLDPAHQWPFTVTIAVPASEVRYVGTRFSDDGTVIGGRVWIGGVEVCTPNDPISFPGAGDLAHVDVHVSEFRVGGDRTFLD